MISRTCKVCVCFEQRHTKQPSGKMAHAVAGHSGPICCKVLMQDRSNHGTELTYGEG